MVVGYIRSSSWNQSYGDFQSQCEAGFISASICRSVNRVTLLMCTLNVPGAPDSPQQCSDYWREKTAKKAMYIVAGVDIIVCLLFLLFCAVSLCGVFAASRASKALVLVSAACNALILFSFIGTEDVARLFVLLCFPVLPLLSLVAAIQWLRQPSLQQASSDEGQGDVYVPL